MSTIVKGDQYVLPIQIKKGSTVLTPNEVSDVRIQVGNNLKEYSKSQITFNTTTNKWEYPITQSESMKFDTILEDVQIGVKINNELRYAPKQSININENIIAKEW